MTDPRARLLAALAKPIDELGIDAFDPWEDVITGIYGNYASECDYVFIAALEAVRDRKTFDFMSAQEGFMGEFVLYVLAGHGYLEYGSSPRGGWWAPEVEGLLDPLIDKWKAYAKKEWED